MTNPLRDLKISICLSLFASKSRYNIGKMTSSTNLQAEMANTSDRLPDSNSPITLSGPTTAKDQIKARLYGRHDRAGKRSAKTTPEPAAPGPANKSWACARGWIGKEITRSVEKPAGSLLKQQLWPQQMKHLNSEEAIFNTALKCPAEERASHLDQVCNSDHALRERIESL